MESGGQPGNNNAGKNKPWAESLRRALAQHATPGIVQGQALFRIAQNVVQSALDGDKDAIQEIANRLDGKPKQTIDGPGDNGEHIITGVTLKLVRAAKGG